MHRPIALCCFTLLTTKEQFLCGMYGGIMEIVSVIVPAFIFDPLAAEGT